MLTKRYTHNRFHEDYHGEVLAELLDDSAAKTGFEPYLGLHFPATDLPQTVGQLFKTEHVRGVCCDDVC